MFYIDLCLFTFLIAFRYDVCLLPSNGVLPMGLRKVRPMFAKDTIPNVDLPSYDNYAIDSTTIHCSIILAELAFDKRSKGGTKMHISIPDIIYVTDSKWIYQREEVSERVEPCYVL